MSQTASSQRRGNWDVFHSTYYWILDLDQRDPRNSALKLTGYSKKVGENEAQDKDQLLRRKIVTLFQHGYRTRCTCIHFYKSTGHLVNKNTDPCILKLFPNHYEIPESEHDYMFKLHGKFLKDLYYAIKINADLSTLVPTRSQRILPDNDQYLNPDRYSFKDLSELYAHAARCLKHGHEQGHVDYFIIQCRSRMNI